MDAGMEPICPEVEPFRAKVEPIPAGMELFLPGTEPIRPEMEPIRARMELFLSGIELFSPETEPIRSGLEPLPPDQITFTPAGARGLHWDRSPPVPLRSRRQ